MRRVRLFVGVTLVGALGAALLVLARFSADGSSSSTEAERAEARRSTRVSRPGRARAVIEASVAPALDPDSALRLRDGASLEVTVLEAETRIPVEGAWLRLDRGDGAPEPARADRFGRARFGGLARSITIDAAASGYQPSSLVVTPPRDADASTVLTATVVLERGGRVVGIVTDSLGRPVSGATVYPERVPPRFRHLEAETDPAGRWAFDALAPGTWIFEAWDENHAPGRTDSIDIGPAGARGLVITLPDGVTIAGRVVDETGSPVPGADVEVASGAFPTPDMLREARTDEAGGFRIPGLPPTALHLRARAGDRSSTAEIIDGAGMDVDRIEIRLTPSAISGRVLGSNGSPAKGALIAAASSSGNTTEALSGADGAFTLRGLEPGRYVLYATWSADRSMTSAPLLEAETGQSGLVLRLDPPGALIADVRGPSGAPLSSYIVRLDNLMPAEHRSPELRIGGLNPGEHTLRLSSAGHTTRALTVSIATGKTLDLGRIRLDRGRRVSGLVLDWDRRPVALADVFGAGADLAVNLLTLGSPDGTPDDYAIQTSGAQKVVTDAEGRFSIEGVERDAVILMADHASLGRSAPIELAAGKEDRSVTLWISRPGTIRGRVHRAWVPVEGTNVRVSASQMGRPPRFTTCAADGTFLFERVVPGEYGLGIWLDHQPQPELSVRITARSGETSTHDFDLGPEP